MTQMILINAKQVTYVGFSRTGIIDPVTDDNLDGLQDPVVTYIEGCGLSPWQVARERAEVQMAVAKLRSWGVEVEEIDPAHIRIQYEQIDKVISAMDLVNLVDAVENDPLDRMIEQALGLSEAKPLPTRRQDPRFNKKRDFRKGEHHDLPIESSWNRRYHNRAYRSRCKQVLKHAVATQDLEDVLIPTQLPLW